MGYEQVLCAEGKAYAETTKDEQRSVLRQLGIYGVVLGVARVEGLKESMCAEGMESHKNQRRYLYSEGRVVILAP